MLVKIQWNSERNVKNEENWTSIWSTSEEESAIDAFLQHLQKMCCFFFTFFINLFFSDRRTRKTVCLLFFLHTKELRRKNKWPQHQKMYQKHFNIIFNFEKRFSHTHRRNSNDNFWILFCFCLSFAVEIERNNTCRVISHQQEIRNRNRESAMRKREREREITPLFSLWKTDFLRVE